MKKRILLIVALASCLASTNAQTPSSEIKNPHDLRISIGPNLGIGSDFCPIFGCSYDDDIFFGFYRDTYNGNLLGTPIINAGYTYKLKKWLAVGAIASFRSTWRNEHQLIDNSIIGRSLKRQFSITPTARFDWYRGKLVDVYASVSLGVGYVVEKDIDKKNNKTYKDKYFITTGELIPFGMTVGRKAFGFFEIGPSNIGFVKVGFGYRFNN